MNTTSSNRFFLAPMLMGFSTIFGFSNAAFGEDVPTFLGKLEHRTYCRVGQGDGPMASELKSPPSNLQVLSKNNNGTFPRAQRYEVIDGRKTVRAHGTSDRPIWGAVYSAKILSRWAGDNEPPPSSVEAEINGRILSLIDICSQYRLSRQPFSMVRRGKADFSDDDKAQMNRFCGQDGDANVEQMTKIMNRCGCRLS